MNIKAIGGEFALIQRLSERLAHDSKSVLVGIGDDAAVLETTPDPAPYLLATTDMLVENRHFKTCWAAPWQIGMKAVECNVSDIAAMGGRPTWMFISLGLRPDCDVEWVEGMYDGINQSCRRHGVVVAGGDTTSVEINIINITLLGLVDRPNLCLRSQACPGDVIMVTGSLGASAAALALLEKKERPGDHLMTKHLTPTCRLDIAEHIAPWANAMIDISDGLGSDLRHICTQSKVSAEIDAGAIPIHPDTIQAAAALGNDPLALAIGGGEDFELLFSIPPENVPRVAGLDCHPIGRIVPGTGQPVLIGAGGERKELIRGFNHFRARASHHP
jgi:thiamine-monophosphate kinase